MTKIPQNQLHDSATSERLQALGVDPAVVERHLSTAVPHHQMEVTSPAHRDRYLKLHLVRLIPLRNNCNETRPATPSDPCEFNPKRMAS